jgi:aminoglycoside/choline kinase family phosphotransferase
MTESHTARRCIWPRTSNPSSRSTTGLRERGFSAPAIHHADLDAGFLITEDFGIAGLSMAIRPHPIAERYEAATDCWRRCIAKLARNSAAGAEDHYAIPDLRHRRAVGRDRIDARMVSAGPRRRADRAMRAEFVTMWRDLLSKPASTAKTWVLRDFHSPNLIWLDERPDIARVGIIDFQDAVLGPPPTIWCRCCRMRGSMCPSNSSLRC